MNTVKWGLIGCGDIANKRVGPALRGFKNCELLAVSRKRFEMAQSFADKFGAKKTYKTWQELLCDDEIDDLRLGLRFFAALRMTIPK